MTGVLRVSICSAVVNCSMNSTVHAWCVSGVNIRYYNDSDGDAILLFAVQLLAVMDHLNFPGPSDET